MRDEEERGSEMKRLPAMGSVQSESGEKGEKRNRKSELEKGGKGRVEIA